MKNLFDKGLTLMRSGKHRQAIKYFQKAQSNNPDDIYAMCNIGICLGELGEYDMGLKILLKLRKIEEDNSDILYAIGLLNFYKGNVKIAAKYLKMAVDLEPNLLKAVRFLSICLLLLGRYDKAIEYLRLAEALDPSDELVLYNLMIRLFKRGDKKEARIRYDRLKRIDPDFEYDGLSE